MDNLESLLEEQGRAFEAFKAKFDAEMKTEREEREALELKLGRLSLNGTASSSANAELKAFGEVIRAYIKTGDTLKLDEYQAKASQMSVDNNPAGGYSVIPGFSDAINRKIFDLSPIRQIARIQSISSEAFEEINDLNLVTGSWVGERQARLSTVTPDIGKWRIDAKEIYANPPVTQKLLDDSAINVGQWLVDKIGQAFAIAEGTAFVSGDGVLQPRGFLSYASKSVSTDDDTRAWGVLQYVATGGASDFASSNPGDALVDLQGELKTGYLSNAVWVMNRRTAAKIRKFKDGQGNYLWQQAIVPGTPNTLLGHAVVLAEDMPAVGSNAYPVAFGDFKAAYCIVDRMGDRLIRDDLTNKPFVNFYTARRVGGDVINFEAIKLLKCATS